MLEKTYCLFSQTHLKRKLTEHSFYKILQTEKQSRLHFYSVATSENHSIVSSAEISNTELEIRYYNIVISVPNAFEKRMRTKTINL